MNVPLLDLKAQYAPIKTEIEAAALEVLQSQHFILGPKVTECEAAIARYSGCAHGIGVASGTDALLVCLMAENIGPGDEVITTPFTFFATAGSIARTGATPVFVDIDPATYNLDPAGIEAKITARTKAVMPVHLYGQMADMVPLLDLARKHHLVVVEDAAQAIGSESQGRRAGSLGDYGCFSFFPSKNLGGVGDGGMVVTEDAARAEKLRCLRAHGSKPKYYHSLIGGNFRLDALQAAVVNVKLKYLDQWTERRQQNARRYDLLFKKHGVPTLDSRAFAALRRSGGPEGKIGGAIVTPAVGEGRHIFNQYVIRVERRDDLRAWLKKHGVETEIYYPVPMHLQECFRYLDHRPGDFPESEQAAQETLALPVYPELNDDQAEHVVKCIGEFLANRPV